MELFQRYFVDILKNHYADFQGRASRSEYWYFALFSFIIAILLSFIDSAVLGAENGQGMLDSLYSLVILLPSVGLGIRRLHDIG